MKTMKAKDRKSQSNLNALLSPKSYRTTSVYFEGRLSPYALGSRLSKNSQKTKRCNSPSSNLPNHQEFPKTPSLRSSPSFKGTNSGKFCFEEINLCKYLPKNPSIQLMHEKLKVYSDAFDKIIKKETSNSKALKRIKNFYENFIATLENNPADSDNRTFKQIYSENKNLKKKVTDYKRRLKSTSSSKVSKLVQQNNNLTSQVKYLQEQLKQKDLKLTPSTTSSNTFRVPPLNLKSCVNKDFHQEFLEKAEEFSCSWREAIEEGR